MNNLTEELIRANVKAGFRTLAGQRSIETIGFDTVVTKIAVGSKKPPRMNFEDRSGRSIKYSSLFARR